MGRLIDADKAKEVLTKLLYETALNNSGGASLMCEDIAENRLETWFGLVPTVDAETVKHGRWEPMDLTWGRNIYCCTNCGKLAEVPTNMGKPMYTFCPNCGAKMVEPKHGYWIREPNCWYRCSECGSLYPSNDDNMNYHYCPDCGAKIDGEVEDDETD